MPAGSPAPEVAVAPVPRRRDHSRPLSRSGCRGYRGHCRACFPAVNHSGGRECIWRRIDAVCGISQIPRPLQHQSGPPRGRVVKCRARSEEAQALDGGGRCRCHLWGEKPEVGVPSDGHKVCQSVTVSVCIFGQPSATANRRQECNFHITGGRN